MTQSRNGWTQYTLNTMPGKQGTHSKKKNYSQIIKPTIANKQKKGDRERKKLLFFIAEYLSDYGLKSAVDITELGNKHIN
jgi:hypothetical protein